MFTEPAAETVLVRVPAENIRRDGDLTYIASVGRLIGPFEPAQAEIDGRVPDLSCLKCGDADVSVRYCDGCSKRTYNSICRHGSPEHLHRHCRRCGYEWTTDDVIDAKAACDVD